MGKIRKRPEVPDYIVRRVDGVPLTFLNEAGEQVKENFTIEFKSFTERGAILPNGVLPYSALFQKTIVAIIDSEGEALTDETGEPAVFTREFFAGMLPEDLEAIDAAVKADARPPKPSPTPGDSGSSPAASEG